MKAVNIDTMMFLFCLMTLVMISEVSIGMYTIKLKENFLFFSEYHKNFHLVCENVQFFTHASHL